MKYLLAVTMVLVMAMSGYAEPTPTATKLLWDDYTDPDAIGFFGYWAPQIESPRMYGDARKIDLGRPDNEEVVLLDVKPDISGNLCWKVTAYDAAGNESGFSNEACDWFGITIPFNLRTEPVVAINPPE